MVNQQTHFRFYTATLFGCSFGYALCILLSLGVVFAMGLRTSRILHKKMIKAVLMAPINLYYDVTPTGVVLNRFSKDLSAIDD
jgi:ABC-type multidrug transport system fused ATPase/permease subunit|tara:strand:+ start:660 stop:908 length:249 start_codon:yes stop_codon:yes gene_type:complete